MSAILSVNRVSKRFTVPRSFPGRTLDAVAGVSLELSEGRTVGIVGESGSGKTTLGRMIVGLERPSEGSVEVCGVDMFAASRIERRAVRPRVQMVFQDPRSSLDPRLTAESAVREPLLANGIVPRAASPERAIELLEMCGLSGNVTQRFPHELSGGQRQRVSIARALASEPRIIVLDEPTSALDVSVQAQVLNLLKDLQEELGLGYVFVSHDLAVVRSMSDQIVVMKNGAAVEQGPAERIFGSPEQEYTRRLLAAVPRLARRSEGAER
ncbi:MAG: ABC transporter ATP-binding protein [Candidatus Leucobacter sulfamidivorax]|nr:ABC transporter ATP-binding protein [Candidatus Leucobacter sulfamidivorax]